MKIDPVDYIKKFMEKNNYKQKDMVPFIGNKSKVSEILHKKRKLSLPMIKALHKHCKMNAEILIQEYALDEHTKTTKFQRKKIKHIALDVKNAIKKIMHQM